MKALLILSFFIITGLTASSQNRVEVEMGEKKMSRGNQMAFTVMVPDAKTEQLEVLWRKYVNTRPTGEHIDNLNTQIGNIFRSKEKRIKRERLKMVKEGEELYVRSVEINGLSNYPMDVYAHITQLPEGCLLSAFFQYTDSVFINESTVEEEKLASFGNYVRDFGVEAYRTVVDNNLKLANKEVSKEEN